MKLHKRFWLAVLITMCIHSGVYLFVFAQENMTTRIIQSVYVFLITRLLIEGVTFWIKKEKEGKGPISAFNKWLNKMDE